MGLTFPTNVLITKVSLKRAFYYHETVEGVSLRAYVALICVNLRQNDAEIVSKGWFIVMIKARYTARTIDKIVGFMLLHDYLQEYV